MNTSQQSQFTASDLVRYQQLLDSFNTHLRADRAQTEQQQQQQQQQPKQQHRQPPRLPSEHCTLNDQGRTVKLWTSDGEEMDQILDYVQVRRSLFCFVFLSFHPA